MSRTPIRTAIAVLLAGGAIAAFVLLDPTPTRTLDDIELANDLNAALADSAPQQTVANGWTANDYLAYLAEQQDASNLRLSALVALLVIGVAAILVTTRSEPVRVASQGETPSTASPTQPRPQEPAPSPTAGPPSLNPAAPSQSDLPPAPPWPPQPTANPGDR